MPNDLADNLALYAETAAAARHPVQHDDAVGLALREIRNKAEVGFITAEDADRIEQSFYSGVAERQARRDIAANPDSALARLNDGADFAALAEDTRARLTAEAGRAVQAQTVRRDTEAAASRRETLIRLPGYLDSLRDGGLPDDDRFTRDSVIATLGEEAGGKSWAEIEAAQAFGEQMAAIRWATPGEISDLLDRGDHHVAHQKMPDVLGSGAEYSEQNLLQLAAARRDRQLHDKPADYVLANPHIAELHGAMVQATAQPVLPPAVSAALQSGGTSLATAAYANATLAEQERLGVPEGRRQLLPETMAKEIVTGILGGDPAKADRTLRDLAGDWGGEWPRVLADLHRAGLAGEYRLLAGFDDPVARQGFAKSLTAQAADEPGALRTKAGADADAIDGLLPDALAPLHGWIAQIYGDGVVGQSLSDDATRAARLLAYRHAPFTEPREAVRRAVADLAGNALLQERPGTTGSGAGGGGIPDWIGWPDEGGEPAATPRDLDAAPSQDQSNNKSLLERMFPPGSPEETSDRAAAMGDAGRRLGRHVPRVPVPRVPVPRVSVKPNAASVFLKNGERLKIFDASNQEVDAVIPEGWSLDYFRIIGQTLRGSDSPERWNKSASLPALATLLFFRRGGHWDLQRIDAPKGTIHHEFRPITNFMTGFYGAAIGLSFEQMMAIQVGYAKGSKWSEKEVRSEKYFPLPESNVNNIKRGYETYLQEK